MRFLFFFWRKKRPGPFVTIAAIDQLLSAHTLDELQKALEARPDVLVTRYMYDHLKRFCLKLKRDGHVEESRRLETPMRVIKNALRIGVPQAIAAEKQDTQQMAEAVFAILQALPWNMEGVVQQHLAILAQPGCLHVLQEYHEQQRQESEHTITRDVRAMKIQYVEESIQRSVPYAERRFKQRFQQFAKDQGIQQL